MTEVTFDQTYYIDCLVKDLGLQDEPDVHVLMSKDIESRFDPEKMSKKNLPDVPFRSTVMRLMWNKRLTRPHELYASSF